MSDWSPWIAHDGAGLPLPLGTLVERKFDDIVWPRGHFPPAPGRYHIGPLVASEAANWTEGAGYPLVIRYRYKRPPQLRRLMRLAELAGEEVAA